MIIDRSAKSALMVMIMAVVVAIFGVPATATTGPVQGWTLSADQKLLLKVYGQPDFFTTVFDTAPGTGGVVRKETWVYPSQAVSYSFTDGVFTYSYPSPKLKAITATGPAPFLPWQVHEGMPVSELAGLANRKAQPVSIKNPELGGLRVFDFGRGVLVLAEGDKVAAVQVIPTQPPGTQPGRSASAGLVSSSYGESVLPANPGPGVGAAALAVWLTYGTVSGVKSALDRTALGAQLTLARNDTLEKIDQLRKRAEEKRNQAQGLTDDPVQAGLKRAEAKELEDAARGLRGLLKQIEGAYDQYRGNAPYHVVVDVVGGMIEGPVASVISPLIPMDSLFPLPVPPKRDRVAVANQMLQRNGLSLDSLTPVQKQNIITAIVDDVDRQCRSEPEPQACRNKKLGQLKQQLGTGTTESALAGSVIDKLTGKPTDRQEPGKPAPPREKPGPGKPPPPGEPQPPGESPPPGEPPPGEVPPQEPPPEHPPPGEPPHHEPPGHPAPPPPVYPEPEQP